MAFTPKEHITQYLNGELDDDQLLIFQRAMETDKELRDAVALQKRVEKELSDRAEIEALLQNADKAHPYVANRKTPVRSLPKWLILAAVVVIGIGSWFLLRTELAAPDALASRYGALNLPESVLPSNFARLRSNGLPQTRDANSDSPQMAQSNTIADSARNYLFVRQYQEALTFYQRLGEDSLTDSLRFERGVLLLKDKQPTAALADFEQISISYNGGLSWYKSLAHLQLLNKEKARQELQQILELSKSPYRPDAEKLLEQL